MKPNAAWIGALALLVGACTVTPDYGRPLPEGAPALLPLRAADRRPDFSFEWYRRQEIVPAVDLSIEWMQKPSSRQFFPIEGISHGHALASLQRFREILLSSSGPEDFDATIEREFQIYKSAGWDGRGGGVLFTAYCTPILQGSTKPGYGFDYPLYALPPDLVKGEHGEILGRRTTSGALEPYPTRRAIEAGGLLHGQDLELVWLTDPLDGFIAHVNGSAFVETPDGELLRFGYSGKNGREYTSLGKELVKAGELTAEELSLQRIRQWGERNPERLQEFLNRNDSFVFFAPIEGNPHGSLNVPVTTERSLATDKSLFPRGALVFVDTELGAEGDFERFMLDQDTGGAIRTAGRADIYLGIGPEAEFRAGQTRNPGQLYYLFLKDLPQP
jgi:membrane-bound lytic murein transglycosylase A